MSKSFFLASSNFRDLKQKKPDDAKISVLVLDYREYLIKKNGIYVVR